MVRSKANSWAQFRSTGRYTAKVQSVNADRLSALTSYSLLPIEAKQRTYRYTMLYQWVCIKYVKKSPIDNALYTSG